MLSASILKNLPFSKLICATCLCLLLTSCASIVSSTSRCVTIASNPPGADFTLKQSNGFVVCTGVTPASIQLNCSRGYFQPARYYVEYTRNEVTKTVPLNATLNGWYLGNVVFGGLIGLLIVDPATGAMWTLDRSVIANFHQRTMATSKGGICSLDQVPFPLRKHLVAIN